MSQQQQQQQNKQLILVRRPKGPITEDNFEIRSTDIPKLSTNNDNNNKLVAKTLQCSVDPYMRSRMNESKSYVEPFELNKPISGFIISQVTESNSDKFKVGDLITGVLPFQEYNLIDLSKDKVFPVHPTLSSGKLPLSYGLSALGMPGMTAWVGLLHITNPKPGETVLVSAAAGAVGSMVGQIAKIKGCYTVGIAGSDEKVKQLKEKFGFDDGFNYKTTSYLDGIKKTCPKGIDVYFDNVGGEALDAALMNLNRFGRISICGAISQYNEEKPPMGPRLTPLLLGSAGRMEGFIVGYYEHLYPQAANDMAQWLLDGKLKMEETSYDGFENIPKAFIGLMTGENIGKMYVKIADVSK